MKIQISYRGVEVSAEGDDVTIDMFSTLYDQLKAELDTMRFVTRLDGKTLQVAMQRDGYKEFIRGLNGEPIEVVSKPSKPAETHQTMAEKGVVNSPDKSPFATGGVFNKAVHAI